MLKLYFLRHGETTSSQTGTYCGVLDLDLTPEDYLEKYHESIVVNFQGETVELEETILSSNDDLEWFKKNVQARALEHGYCGRPNILGDCDIPGFDGCYSCSHWRTNKNFLPILRDTLEMKPLNMAIARLNMAIAIKLQLVIFYATKRSAECG
jgi:hypothetical protein